MKIKNKRSNLKERGITLIALVVTIVVLLILAGVSISALFGDNGIINKAKEAQNKINESVENDQKNLNELSNWLDNQINGKTSEETTGGEETTTVKWTQNKTTVTNGTTTYTVGDDYTYNCGVEGYTGGWKVLGAEDGELLIMSTVDVGTLGLKGKSGDGTTDYPAGYLNGIDKLNTMCEPYGTKARSIKVEDINRVTGYDPTNQGDGTVYSVGEFYEYGNKVTYTASGSSATNGKTYTGSISYEHPDGREIGTDNVTSITVESTSYYYYSYSLTKSSSTTGECKGIATDSSAYEMLFMKADKSAKCSYWLASSCVSAANSSLSFFGLRDVDSGGGVGYYNLWYSNGYAASYSLGVRAVVSL